MGVFLGVFSEGVFAAVGVFFMEDVGVFLVDSEVFEEGVFFAGAGVFFLDDVGVFLTDGGVFAVGVFLPLAGVLEGVGGAFDDALVAFFTDFLALRGGGDAGGVAGVAATFFAFGVVFLDVFPLGDASCSLATGDLIWPADLLFCAFWVRVSDFPRGSRDSLFDLEAALLLGGEGTAFSGLGATGDKALFLPGVFLREDSVGAGAFRAGDTLLFGAWRVVRDTGRALRDFCFLEVGGDASVLT